MCKILTPGQLPSVKQGLHISVTNRREPISSRCLKIFPFLVITLSGLAALIGYILGSFQERCEIEGFPHAALNKFRKGLPSPKPTLVATFNETGSYYVELGTKRNWDEAYAYCKNHKMSLASIYSPAEAKALAKLTSQIWTGGLFKRWLPAAYHWQYRNKTKSVNSAKDVIKMDFVKTEEQRTCLAFAGKMGRKDTLIARYCNARLDTACETFRRKRYKWLG